MYYLLQVTRGLTSMMEEAGIEPKGYVKGIPCGLEDGIRYAIIDSSDAMGIKLIDPENVYICAFGPFEPMNVDAFEEHLPTDYCAPRYEHPHRRQAMNFLLSKPFGLL